MDLFLLSKILLLVLVSYIWSKTWAQAVWASLVAARDPNVRATPKPAWDVFQENWVRNRKWTWIAMSIGTLPALFAVGYFVPETLRGFARNDVTFFLMGARGPEPNEVGLALMFGSLAIMGFSASICWGLAPLVRQSQTLILIASVGAIALFCLGFFLINWLFGGVPSVDDFRDLGQLGILAAAVPMFLKERLKERWFRFDE